LRAKWDGPSHESGGGVRLHQRDGQQAATARVHWARFGQEGRGMEYIWVGIGGFLGANARYILGGTVANRLGTTFPYGTLIVNLTGAVVIGILLTLLTDRVVTDPHWRQLTVVGFLGGYTTFSSYTFEAIGLMQSGRWTSALLYVIGSNVLGLIACYLGIVAARSLGT
jgi:CrcB protein